MRYRSSIVGLFLVGIIIIGGFSSLFAQDDVLNSERKTSQYPPDFQIDDLVFFDSTYPPGRWNVPGLDHIAIYLGNDSFICTTKNKTTHAREVNIVSNDTLFHNDLLKNPRYARVINTTSEQRHAATMWMTQHVKDKYQTYDPRKIPDPNASIITADRWYCSEIIWAAYYNTGIDIDKNGWNPDFPWFFPIWSSVSCDDIYYDNDVIHFS